MKIIFLLFTITINWSRIMVHFCHTSPKGRHTHCSSLQSRRNAAAVLSSCDHSLMMESLQSWQTACYHTMHIGHNWFIVSPLLSTNCSASWLVGWCATCARAELAGKNTIHRIHTLAQYTTGLGPPRLHQPDALISFASSIWILILQWQYWCSINKSTSYWK